MYAVSLLAVVSEEDTVHSLRSRVTNVEIHRLTM